MEEFIFFYNQLSHNYRLIVLRVMREMKHKKAYFKKSEVSPDIRTGLKKILKEQGMTEGQLIREINIKKNVKYNNAYDCRETFLSMMKRNSTRSELLPTILEILGISKEELYKASPIKNVFFIQAKRSTNPRWLFDTLTKENQKVIMRLIYSLCELELHFDD